MWIREGKPVADFPAEGKQVQIFTKNQVVTGMFDWADQILCATNNKRNEINDFVRQQKGFGFDPCEGDKVISLHNHWDYLSNSETWALTNGCIGTLTDFYGLVHNVPHYITKNPIQVMYATSELEDGDCFTGTPIDYQALTTGEPALDGHQCYLLRKHKASIDPPYDFAYAYAITCHKAQGSEWDKVLIFEEKFPYNKEEHKRWLYTAVTRARDKVVIVRDS
jgi:exodeoxyribonuclease-5